MHLKYKCLLQKFGTVTTFEETWQAIKQAVVLSLDISKMS